MKNISYFDKEIDALVNGTFENKKDRDKAVKQVQFLRDCKRYIETNPREDFLHDEKKRLRKLLDYIRDTEVSLKFTPERVKEFRSEMGFTMANKHLEIIKFIIQP